MAHIDDVEHAEDDRQPEGDQHHGDPEREPVDDLWRQHELEVVEGIHVMCFREGGVTPPL